MNEKLDNESDTVTLVLPVVVLILGRLAYTQNEAAIWVYCLLLNGRKTLPLALSDSLEVPGVQIEKEEQTPGRPLCSLVG
jgi:hypothetical protein